MLIGDPTGMRCALLNMLRLPLDRVPRHEGPSGGGTPQAPG